MLNSITEVTNLIFDHLRGVDMMPVYAYIKEEYGVSEFSKMTLVQLKSFLKYIEQIKLSSNATVFMFKVR